MKEIYTRPLPQYSFYMIRLLAIRLKENLLFFKHAYLFTVLNGKRQRNDCFTISGLIIKFSAFLKLVIPVILMGLGVEGRAQADGDFQTKNTAGDWSDYLSWNIRSGGSWIAAAAGQLPATTSGVFVQTGHTINVNITTAVCNDLNFISAGTTLKVILLANSILTIYGSLVQTDNTNVPFPNFGAGAKIIFAGSASQTITNSGISTNLHNVEINKSGGSFTLPGGNTSFDVFTLTSGNVVGAMTAVLTGLPSSSVNINGGTWTQILGSNRINGGTGVDIPLTINGGTMTLATNSLASGFNFSNVNIQNGGILNLNNFPGNINITNSLSIDAASTLNNALTTFTVMGSMSFLGTVNYTHTAGQNIINTTYTNLGLSGSGNKTPSANLNITGNITISGSAILPLVALTATVGGNWTNYGSAGFTESTSTVDFNGTGAQSINTTGGEDFFRLRKSGAGILTLNSDARFGGTSSELNISDGILDAGTNTLSGTPSTALTMSAGTLKLAKLNTILPEFAITSFSLTGTSTIELNGSVGIQTLQGSRVYRNLGFTNSGTKTVTSAPTSITGTITVANSAILDVGNRTMGGMGTNLTMTDNSRYRTEGTGTKPDAQGVYSLGAGTTVDFANIAASQQNVRLGTTYYNIDVSGTSVGNASASPGTPITLQAGGTFTVKGGGIFYLANVSGFTGGTNTAVNIANNPAVILENNSTVGYNGALAQIITNTLPYQNLMIAGSGIKTAPAGNLIIEGDLIKSGASTFEANGGSVLLNGLSQSFAGLVYNILLLDNPGTKTLSGNATILDYIRIGNLSSGPATLLILGENYITLKSTAAKTARVAPIAPAAAIGYGTNGRFVVERNYTPRRAWRLVTAPVTVDADKSVFTSWQMGGVVSSGSGTFVTGPSAPANGLDWSPLNNYSLKTFDGTNLVGVNSTTSTLISGTAGTTGIPDNYGMFLFVRGDRSTTNLFYPPFMNETTLRDTGKLQIRTQTFNLTGPVNGYSLIGNPYASQVNMDDIMASGVGIDNSKYYMYDPYLNADQGGYLTYTADINGVFTSTPPSPGGQTNNLHSSQAFYVQRTNSNATIIFTENNKTGSASLGLFRPASFAQTLRADLYLVNADNATLLADGIKVRFDQGYTNLVDNADAVKFTNIREDLALLRDDKMLAVENRSPVSINDTLFFNLTHTAPRNYQFRFEPENLDPLLIAFLEDSYTGTKTQVSVTSPGSYNFTVSANPKSYAANRFRIVLKLAAGGALPVTYSSIRAWQQGSNIALEWTVKNEVGISEYEVEKSVDGINFGMVNTTIANGANQNNTTYSWLDQNAVTGNNFYRVRSINSNGKMEYSSIVKVKMGKLSPGISIYPNPVTDGVIGVGFSNMPAGVYNAKLINIQGQTILTRIINHSPGESMETIRPDYKIASGIYQLDITAPDKRIITNKVVIH